MPDGRSGNRHTLKITSGAHRGKTVRFGGGKRTYGALRKTTKKGAYKKNAKKNFQVRRAPFVESKKRIQSRLEVGTPAAGIMNQTGNSLTTPFAEQAGTQLESGPGHPLYQLIPGPWSYLDMKQGLDDDQMIGSSVFSRYLTQKIRIKFPAGNSAWGVNGAPLTWYLIHGFVTVPIKLNEYTTTKLGEATRPFINAHIATYLKPYFDMRSDMLSFDNQRSSTIKVIRKLKLKTNRNTDMNIPASGTSMGIVGSGPEDLYVNCRWKTNRKTHYIKGIPSGDPADTEFRYPDGWIPFTCFYSPTLAQAGGNAGPIYWQDNCHWFTDS
ncbi:MAG: hypothetical protein [Circular genetic element sp.]|nr:MAG: hypothetical protein [Circular genetic element sp.]